MAKKITFDVAEFRSMFPEFSDPVTFPDVLLQGYFVTATCYMTNTVGNRLVDCLTRDCRKLALYQLTAHIAQLAINTQAGQSSTLETSASVGSVSVGNTPTPFGNSTFAYWLSTTPYGQALLVLLRGCSAGGYYIGSRYERSAFRKVGGRF